MKKYKLALVGATGLVGRKALQVLEEFNLPISELPAGTTPCWYEMTLCNFGYLGYLVGIFGLIAFCYFADSMKQIKSKSLVFMFVLVLLTQNTDVYVVYILFIFMYYLGQHIKHPKIVFRIGGK